jgi:diguanylate cyclase (GGDEF)-like protein
VAEGVFSLDGPRPLSVAVKGWTAAAIGGYFAVVVAAYLRADDDMRALPAIALAHALLAACFSAITALLMVGHARNTGRRGYLLIGGTFAYLAAVLAFLPLFFPGAIFSDRSIWGDLQSATNLYYAWHFAFPIGIAASAVLIYTDQRSHRRPGLTRAQEWGGLAVTLLGVGVTVVLAAIGSQLLPAVIEPDGTKTPYAMVLDVVLVVVCLITVVITAFCARNGSLIGMWLAALALLVLGEAVVNQNATERFTVGWYASRFLWLMAVGALLLALVWNLSRIDRANSELAARDSLTGCESRISLVDTMTREIARSRDLGTEIALLWVDLDGFKGVNDQLGHQVGDDVLREMVARLFAQVRDGDHVGRLGGDEFGVLLCDDVEAGRVNAVAERVLAAIREPVRGPDSLIHVTAAVGVARAPADARTAEDLLLCADLAMYAAKNRGGDRFEPFNSVIGTEAVSKARLRHDLASALRNDDFCLHYQPIFESNGTRVAGVEALARWVRDGEPVSAGEFVPFAEQSGQIISLGRTVVRHLAGDLPRWLDTAPADFFVSLNLSVKELADTPLVEEILALGCHLDRLVLEVTESLELQESSEAERNLERLREAGLRVAIDDFGAGFSNFTRLEHLRPSLIKIDRSLVRRAGSEKDGGVAFLTAATSVAASLGCAVVAEGVETQAEAEVVQLLGIEYVQGFRYQRPGPIEQFRPSAVG